MIYASKEFYGRKRQLLHISKNSELNVRNDD
jgi:hypothetical protein